MTCQCGGVIMVIGPASDPGPAVCSWCNNPRPVKQTSGMIGLDISRDDSVPLENRRHNNNLPEWPWLPVTHRCRIGT
jgi:hypothetical protein